MGVVKGGPVEELPGRTRRPGSLVALNIGVTRLHHTQRIQQATSFVAQMIARYLDEPTPDPVMPVIIGRSHRLPGLRGDTEHVWSTPSDTTGKDFPQRLFKFFDLVRDDKRVLLIPELDRVVEVAEEDLGPVPEPDKMGAFAVGPFRGTQEPSCPMEFLSHVEKGLLDRVDHLGEGLPAHEHLGSGVLNSVLDRMCADTSRLTSPNAGNHPDFEGGRL